MKTIESRRSKKTIAGIVALIACLPGIALADPGKRCSERILKGDYVLAATGFTRPPASGPGTPWTPKAILEVIHFNGDGTLSTPYVAIANPFGDSGLVVPPVAGTPGAAGQYVVNDDCSGTVQFGDGNSVNYRIFVDPPEGHTVWMIQTNPPQNVFQGAAKRVK